MMLFQLFNQVRVTVALQLCRTVLKLENLLKLKTIMC